MSAAAAPVQGLFGGLKKLFGRKHKISKPTLVQTPEHMDHISHISSNMNRAAHPQMRDTSAQSLEDSIKSSIYMLNYYQGKAPINARNNSRVEGALGEVTSLPVPIATPEGMAEYAEIFRKQNPNIKESL